MKTSPKHDERIAKMTFASVYPLYLDKVVKKGRTEAELYEVICWLTGFSAQQIQDYAASDVSFQEFFSQADLNPNAELIKGLICGLSGRRDRNPPHPTMPVP
jgi:hypothetical protein